MWLLAVVLINSNVATTFSAALVRLFSSKCRIKPGLLSSKYGLRSMVIVVNESIYLETLKAIWSPCIWAILLSWV